jgi:hypothetical protein
MLTVCGLTPSPLREKVGMRVIKNYIAPTLLRRNAARDAPASRIARALLDELPRRSVGTLHLS